MHIYALYFQALYFQLQSQLLLSLFKDVKLYLHQQKG
jgi:hypothetical protein